MSYAPRIHRFIRFLAIAVTVASITYMGARSQVHSDVTSEGLSRLTDSTQGLIESISEDRAVTVHAFVSKEVPREYVTVRSRLLNVLREMEASGGGGLQVRIIEPEPHSTEAEEAIDKFGIAPRPLFNRVGGRVGEMQVFMGLAFVSGPREEVVPFIDRGLSVEYEVSRALRVVTQEKKKVVGVLRTDATIMGNFDIQTRRQQPSWRIVDELRKQYEVRSLNPNAEVPEDVDVLFVPQLSSLGQGEIDKVQAYIDAGRPALLTADPMPLFDLRLSPKEDKLPPPGQGGGMMGMGGGPPPQPKGNYLGLLRGIGVEWADTRILYDVDNPNPMFGDVPEQVVFIADRPDGTKPFTDVDPVVDGLSQIAVLFGGELKPASGTGTEFKPLLVTGKRAGFNLFDDLVQRHVLFGLSGPIPPRKRSPITGQNHTIAARITGGAQSGDAEGAGEIKDRNVVVVADLDLFGNQFFAMHERGGDLDGDGLVDTRFDNVLFLLNVVDSLAGDDRFIELRKRRPAFRRLEEVDNATRDAREKRETQIQAANDAAETGLEDAQKALDAAVDEIRNREGLDDTTKAILVKSAEEAENRRLQAKQETIERDKARAVTKTEAEHKREVDKIQNGIRLIAVLIPPIPALLLGALIFGRKRQREHETIPKARRLRGRRPPPRKGPSAEGAKKKRAGKDADKPKAKPKPEAEADVPKAEADAPKPKAAKVEAEPKAEAAPKVEPPPKVGPAPKTGDAKDKADDDGGEA